MANDLISRRTVLKVTGASIVAAGCKTRASSNIKEAQNSGEEYDYIVVGSGAGGGPLACRLAEKGFKVLLIDAGSDQGNTINYQVPAFHPMASEDPAMDMGYFVSHYSDETRKKLDSKYTSGKGVFYPRAASIGGCTSHHAMITVYPHASDWAGMAAIAQKSGDASWEPAKMRKYFERLEKCLYQNRGTADASGHGFDGWLPTSLTDTKLLLRDYKLILTLTAAVWNWSQEHMQYLKANLRLKDFVQQLFKLLGRDLNRDSPSRDAMQGLYQIPLAIQDGKRTTVRDYITSTVAKGLPLTVRQKTMATKVNFEKNPQTGKLRAVGINYIERNGMGTWYDPSDQRKETSVIAKREVIVSAGTFNTPHLLMHSGIGARAELEADGIDIPCLIDLPGVGKNLQDRYEVGVISELPEPLSILKNCTFGKTSPGFIGEKVDPCLKEWKSGTGPYLTNGGIAAIITKSDPSFENPDLFIFCLPAHFKGYFPGYSKILAETKNHVTWAILKAHTKNKAGYVKLKSGNVHDLPEVNFKYFDEGTTAGGADQSDLNAMVTGIKMVRKMNERAAALIAKVGVSNPLDVTTSLGELFESTFTSQPVSTLSEILPGPAAATDDDLREFVKREAWGHHASCTCKMGTPDDPMAVVDSKFKVFGTDNLRIVDASIFPEIPGFFIVTSVHMIAEKAAEDIIAAANG